MRLYGRREELLSVFFIRKNIYHIGTILQKCTHVGEAHAPLPRNHLAVNTFNKYKSTKIQYKI